MRHALIGILFGTALVLATSACGAATQSITLSTGPSATSDPSAAPLASASPSSTPAVATPRAWTATGSMINASSGTATLLPDGTVLVAGGIDSIGYLAGTAELYDPNTGSWTATGDMIEARSGHTATLLPDGTVLVIGGIGETGVAVGSAELYDPASRTWKAAGDIVTPRSEHTATLLPDGTVLVVGGIDCGACDFRRAHASAELFDPATGSSTATGDTIEARGSRTATLLPDGTVLVAGGFVGGGVGGFPDALVSAELYDPGTGSWVAATDMIDDRIFGHTATLLPDGTVLVIGGFGLGVGVLASAELYDPGNGSWTATARPVDARGGHTATLLPDGTVLVAGGNDGRGTDGLLASAELYDFDGRSWTTTGEMIEGGGATAVLLLDGTVLVVGSPGASQLYHPD